MAVYIDIYSFSVSKSVLGALCSCSTQWARGIGRPSYSRVRGKARQKEDEKKERACIVRSWERRRERERDRIGRLRLGTRGKIEHVRNLGAFEGAFSPHPHITIALSRIFRAFFIPPESRPSFQKFSLPLKTSLGLGWNLRRSWREKAAGLHVGLFRFSLLVRSGIAKKKESSWEKSIGQTFARERRNED